LKVPLLLHRPLLLDRTNRVPLNAGFETLVPDAQAP
jgi:hypothetical protein